MKYLLPLLCLLVMSVADAQEPACRNDMTGIQTTRNVSDRHGQPYRITDHAADARNTQQFLHAAVNYLYFSNQGSDLRGEFTQYMRVRDASILLPACNSRGQCAEIEVSSRPLQWGGFFGLGIHTGFDVTARFDGTVSTDHIPIDSLVFWNRIPAPNDKSTRCLSNDERDGPDQADSGNDNESDGSDGSFDSLWDEMPEPDGVDYPNGVVEIIDPDEEGQFPREL